MSQPFTKYEGAGLTTKSGETVKPCIEREAGINPCFVGGVACELYREVQTTMDSDTIYAYKLRRLEDGEATTLAAGTEIETYAMQHYRNGYAIIWMGGNGRANSHQEYVQKIKKMVAYGKYENYLVILCREYAEQWVYDGDGYKGIKSLLTDEDGTCHLLYLPPHLIRRGYLLAGLSYQPIDTSSWATDDAIVKAAPRLMATNSSTSYGYETLHFSKWGYKAIGRLADEALVALLGKTIQSGTPDLPTEDSHGTLLYKLTKPVTFKGSSYLDTGVKLYEKRRCGRLVCVHFLQRYADVRSGAVRFDLSYDYLGQTWEKIINADGKNVLIVSKNGTNYSFYMNGYKAYNSALGYPLNEEKYIPTDMSLIFAGRHVGGPAPK